MKNFAAGNITCKHNFISELVLFWRISGIFLSYVLFVLSFVSSWIMGEIILSRRKLIVIVFVPSKE